MNQRVLIFGAGLVTGPLAEYLIGEGYDVSIATRTPAKGTAITKGRDGTRVVTLDVEQTPGAIDDLLSDCDLAVSMLPYIHHPTIAERCIALRKPLVTTSYVSDAMRALDEKASEAGVVLLNECGLDPGIDHMSAMSVIDRIHDEGGKILSFSSYCGGLPAPEANDNPLGYKFSWSPRGVLLASRNPAVFLRDGEEVKIPGPELFSRYETVDIPGVGTFDGYPNRNSLSYVDTYGIPETNAMFRGTLRNRGWCDSLKAFADLGLLDEQVVDWSGKRYCDVALRRATGGGAGSSDPAAAVAEYLQLTEDAHPVRVLDWLGLLSTDALPHGETSPLDVLVGIMYEKMQYEPGERDMVVLQHEFLAETSAGRERITATLAEYGIPHGLTAMSRTVGLPAAIACRLILESRVDATGIQTPVTRQWYEPILGELASQEIRFAEQRDSV
jgi:saccharopine dehydrogenase-like NADP-dependent oxidoreductase